MEIIHKTILWSLKIPVIHFKKGISPGCWEIVSILTYLRTDIIKIKDIFCCFVYIEGIIVDFINMVIL